MRVPRAVGAGATVGGGCEVEDAVFEEVEGAMVYFVVMRAWGWRLGISLLNECYEMNAYRRRAGLEEKRRLCEPFLA